MIHAFIFAGFLSVQPESMNFVLTARTARNFTPDKKGASAYERFVSYMRSFPAPRVLLHGGDFLPRPKKADLFKSRLFARYAAEAISRVKFDAVNVGSNELNWDVNFLLSEAARRGLKLVSASIVDSTDRYVFEPFVSLRIKKQKILITGMLEAPSPHPGLHILSPADVVQRLKDVVQKERPDIVVILLDATSRWYSTIASQFEASTIVLIFQSRIPGYVYAPQPLVKKVYVVDVPDEWRYVATVKISQDENIRGKVVDLINTPPLLGEGAFLLRAQLDTMPSVLTRPPQGFKGAEACRPCHAQEWKSWSRSSHAGAWNSVVKKERRDDPSCPRCHITGWYGSRDEIPSDAYVEKLSGVQCEACHGPGELHVSGKGPVPSGPDKKICSGCHTATYSRQFGKGTFPFTCTGVNVGPGKQ